MKRILAILFIIILFAGCEIHGTLSVTNNRAAPIEYYLFTEGYDSAGVWIIPPWSELIIELSPGIYHMSAFELGTSKQWVLTDFRIRPFWYYYTAFDPDGGANLTTIDI